MPNVNIDIYAKTHGSEGKIKDVSDSLDTMKTKAGAGDSAFKGLWLQMAGGILTIQGVKAALTNVISFMKSAVTEAGNQQLAEQNLKVALESTGREVKNNVEHFKDFASEMQNATIYADDQVMAAQALLIQLTNLDNEGLDAATEGALGLASTFKMDLQAATNLVAKALAGNYGALSRYGLSVSDLNTDEEKRSELLDQLGTLYERAKGETDTYQGSMAQLKNTYSDLLEEVGKTITESEAFKEVVNAIRKAIEDLIESGELDKWFSTAKKGFTSLMKVTGLANSLDLVRAKLALNAAKAEFNRQQFENFKWSIDQVDQGLLQLGIDVTNFIPYLERQKTETENITTQIKNKTTAILALTPALDTYIDKMVGVETILKNVQTEYQNQSTFIYETAIPAANDYSDVVDLAAGEMESDIYSVGEANKTVTTNAKSHWAEFAEGVKSKFSTELGEMLSGAQSFGDGFKDIVGGIKEQFFSMVADMATEWVFGFLGDLTSKTKEAGEGVTDSLGTAVSSVSEGLKGLATLNPSGIVTGAISGVLGGLISGLMGQGGLSKEGMNEHLYRIHDRLQEIKDFIFIDIRTWVIQAWTTLFNTQHSEIMGKMTSLQLLGQNQNAESRAIRKAVKDHLLVYAKSQATDTHNLYKLFSENIQFGQHGLDTTVNRPTMFMAGERGQERVTITPHGGVSSSPVTVHINIQAWDGQDVRRVLENDGRRIFEDMFRRNTGGLTRRLAYETRKY